MDDCLEHELSCAVCLELFEKPVTFPCSHSLCKECLVSITTVDGRVLDFVRCPTCRQGVDLTAVALQKDFHLERIVTLYKEDVAVRLRKTQSCMQLNQTPRDRVDAGNSAQTQTLASPLPSLNLLCSTYESGAKNNVAIQPSASVLDLRNTLDPNNDGIHGLTKCTARCEGRGNNAVILCVSCKNQYCRDCWTVCHNLDLEFNQNHQLHVYVTAFHDDHNDYIECSVCEQQFNEPARLICFNCNMNFCTSCYILCHPVLVISHFIVQRPDVIPKPPRPCKHCTTRPAKLADSACRMCKQEFCMSCLAKISIHKCLKRRSLDGKSGFSEKERNIQRGLINVMQLKKQLIKEIPRFFSKNCQITEVKPELALGDRVVYFRQDQTVKAVVKWIGQLPDSTQGTISAGVKFDQQIGDSDGKHGGRKYFDVELGYGAFIPILSLIKEQDFFLDEPNIYDEIPDLGDDGVTNDTLMIGHRVAYFHNDRICAGSVKWVGKLPDDTSGQIFVGIEFDEPIGSGNGQYNAQRLFFGRMNHSLLVPLTGLMKLEDVQQV